VANIGPIEVLVLFVLVLLPAYFVAKHAESKGYSFALFFIGFLLLWPVALVAALALPDRRGIRGGPPQP
jgi:cell division protein FtsW (lipid II flippase)